MNVLIVGINYYPERTGIAPYTARMAEDLVTYGHRVTVVTGLPSYPHGRPHPRYANVLFRREQIDGVDVRRRWNYVPRDGSAFRRGLYEASFAITGSFFGAPTRPDAVIGIVPSLSGGVLARTIAARYRTPYGVIFQDLLGPAAAQSGVSGGASVAGGVGRVEGWVARAAHAVGVIAPGFGSYLTQLGVDPGRIVRVRNWTHIRPSTSDRDSARARLGWDPGRTVCLHAGNMGFKQALENVVGAARCLRSMPVLFVLMGDGNQKPELERLVKQHSLANVTFLPLQPEDTFPEVLGAADILLLNQRGTVRDMSLPGKLTSYFAAGRPVVAAVAAESESAIEIRTADAGVVVRPDDPEALATAIEQLMSEPEKGALLGDHGREYAFTHLTADAALSTLRSFVERVAAGTEVSEPSRFAATDERR